MFEPELRKIEIFADLTDRELRGLAGLFEEAPLPANHVIFRQGDLAEAFYVIREGAVVIIRDGGDDEPVQLLARLGPGDHFGEFGIYDELVRTASARTAEPSRVLRLDKQALLGVLAEHPTVALRLRTAAGRRPGTARPGAAPLGLGRRREVRTLIGRDVALTLDDGTSRRARLVNLSRGGLCLAGVPEAWRAGQRVRFHLGLGSGVIQLDGEVAWIRDDAVGVAFTQRSQGHYMKIQWTLRQMVRTAGSDDEAPGPEAASQAPRPTRSRRAGSTTAASHSR